jgi:uncharacterized membrane protein
MKKNDQLLEENRSFQLERISLFSDAVMAIAITLLIIELHFTKAITGTTEEFWNNCLHILPQFTGFLLSFILIGLYWTVHHKIFEFVKSFDIKLLWINILFLLSIVLMPFTTKVAFDHFTFPNYPWIFYCLNHIFTGLCIIALWNYLKNNPEKTFEIVTIKFIQYRKWRSVVMIISFLLAIIFAFIHTIISMCSPIFIVFGLYFVKRKFKDVIDV